jgi:hypothetical protein
MTATVSLSSTEMNEIVPTDFTEFPEGEALTVGEHGEDMIRASLNQITWKEVIFMCIGIVGLIDNCFALVVILSSKKMRQKVNNKLIINQSAIDAVASVFLIVHPPGLPNYQSPPGVAGELWCRLWVTNFFIWSCMSASTFNLIGITIERYMEIVKPFTYKDYFTARRVYILVVGVWIGGVIFTILQAVVPSGVVDGTCMPFQLWPSPIIGNIAGVFIFLVSYLIPVIVMVCCYSRIIITFRKKVAPSESSSQSTAERKRQQKLMRIRRNIMKTMITVALAFIICWSADQWIFLSMNSGLYESDYSYYHYIAYFSHSNCWINPFIYIFQYQEFKDAVRKLLRLKSRSADGEETTMMSTVNA